MRKYICIHGHFYQPPRENAWLEVIEPQKSAYPFHDWNERISAECYSPNASSRILNDHARIINIVNNYSGISFNFGPTLLSWMEANDPETYQLILDADLQSRARFNGHGSAIAQAYNHIIMPLASRRDKESQVIWGIADFHHRFNRYPEGMWLPETAVDIETLEVLAENEIHYTILAPRQAKAAKPLSAKEWTEVSGGRVDTTIPYLCRLPSGRSISIFFYNGEIAEEVAFKGILSDGHKFADLLEHSLPAHPRGYGLTNVATDGESYGHHHKHGEMALAYALSKIEERADAKLTNYGEFLAMYPPENEILIYENSSWSCAHGVERWRSACGCSNGSVGGGTLAWRKPLREGLNWLRDRFADIYYEEMQHYSDDPWLVRNQYIKVILDRSPGSLRQFMEKYGPKVQGRKNKTRFIRLLEMQRHSMLMFTSCGWFFDDISRIEAIQILQYANRGIQHAENFSKESLETEFLAFLEKAPSNYMQYKNGRDVYEKEVRPKRVTLSKVGMHYAVASLFDDFPEKIDICNYTALAYSYEQFEAGLQKLAFGKIRLTSKITYSKRNFKFVVLYFGQHQIIGNTFDAVSDDEFDIICLKIREAFENARLSDVMEIIQEFSKMGKFSIWNLFKDEQQKVLRKITKDDLDMAVDSYRKIYNRNYSLMKALKRQELPVPDILMRNLETVINSDIRQFFENGKAQSSRLEKLANEVADWGLDLDVEDIAFEAATRLVKLINNLVIPHLQPGLVQNVSNIIHILLNKMKIPLDLWMLQNAYFHVAMNYARFLHDMERDPGEKQRKILTELMNLGRLINMEVSQLQIPQSASH